jgi:hypothetical protein
MGGWSSAKSQSVEVELAEAVHQAKIKFDAAMEHPNESEEIARAVESYKLALSRFSAFVFDDLKVTGTLPDSLIGKDQKDAS